MKKFLLKVALFLFLFFSSSAVLLILEFAVRKHKLSLDLPQDKTVLFIGDSHIECGVNDKLIPGSFNWAKSAENYLNLFPRVRKLLEVNPQIHTVFVSTTPYSLREHADWNIFRGDAGVLLQPNIIFYGSEDLADCRKTVVNTLKNPRPQRKALLRAINEKTFGTIREFGGFEETGESSEKLWKEIENDGKLGKERISHGRNDESFGNELSLKYLRKIVEFARDRGVRIIFLNPPIYHAEEFYDVPYFEALLQEKFPDVEFWDYAPPLFSMPENCFKDIDHLNSKGAEVFSKELARRMEEGGLVKHEH